MKRCPSCKEIKPLSEFYPQPVIRTCRPCTKAKAAAWQKSPKGCEYRRKYRQTQKHREAQRRTRATYMQNPENRQRVRARCTLNNAIRSGRIHRGPCVDCGTTVDVHGHHHDYAKPLDVTWLCRECHKAQHMNAQASQ